jgi:ABC-type Fe3+-hydroxamate transport system substrate-binding protein
MPTVAMPTVGGTKDPRLDEIVALAPDLVVVNDEENRREDADALAAAGLALHSMSPRSVPDVGPAVRDLAAAIGADVPSPFAPGEWDEWLHGTRRRVGGRVAVLIWRRPWMTMTADTYGASVLAWLGWETVGGDSPARYPEVTLDQLAAAAPELVLLPDEPYPFAPRHVAEVADALPQAQVALIDGQDLFWWGIRTPEALPRLAATLA